ncbi:DUF4288 domain-containing protein [Pyxidicoccus sp. 3LG]
MPWYAASVIQYFEFIHEPQQDYTVWENIYLFNASTPEDALTLAQQHGRAASGSQSEGLRVDGKPARLVFGGVRKVIACAPNPFSSASEPEVETMENGVEATYMSFTVSSKADLDALVRGDAVTLRYEE